MAKVSYQDIETRLRVLEDKMDFTMKAFSVQRKSKTFPPRMTVINLLDVYREVKANDEDVVYASDVAQAADVIDATVQTFEEEQRSGDEVV